MNPLKTGYLFLCLRLSLIATANFNFWLWLKAALILWHAPADSCLPKKPIISSWAKPGVQRVIRRSFAELMKHFDSDEIAAFSDKFKALAKIY